MAKKFRDLTEREILALAISLEEEDARIYADYADGLRDTYPDTAKIFDEMHAEEIDHRNSLMEIYKSRFGDSPSGRQRLYPAPPAVAVAPFCASLRYASRSKSSNWRPAASTIAPSSMSPTSTSASCSAISPMSSAVTTPRRNPCRKR